MDWGAIIQNLFRGFIGEPFIYFSLAAMGLNMHYGYTGLLNFGQAVFMAAGAYGLSMAVVTLGLNFWWGLLLGIVIFPLLLALIMGVPTLRLRADYLAIVTIAASEMFRIIARSPSLDRWTGSSDGLTAFANRFYDFNPFDKQKRYFFGLFIGNQMWVVLVGWIVLSIVVLIVWMTMRSPWGRVLRAIREDEDAARSLGKNAYWFKMQSLMIGGMFGALGGISSCEIYSPFFIITFPSDVFTSSARYRPKTLSFNGIATSPDSYTVSTVSPLEQEQSF